MATLFDALTRPRVDESVREQAKRSLRDMVQDQHSLARELTSLAHDGTPRLKVETVLLVDNASDVPEVRQFVMDCLSAVDEELGIQAAHAAGNMAGAYPEIAESILKAVKTCDSQTPPQLYRARVDALRNVTPTLDTLAVLAAVMRSGPPQAQAAAAACLGMLGRRTPVTDDHGDIPALSSSSETVGRTASRDIRLSAIEVVANVCRQILDEEREDPWIRSCADAILGMLEPLREWVSDERPEPTGVIERLHEVWRDLTPTQKWGLRIAIGTCLAALGFPVSSV